MAESRQELLRSAWLEGKDGALSGREQAKAWALREMWRDAVKADHGMGLAMHIVVRTRAQARLEQGSEHSTQANMNTSSHKPKHIQRLAPNTKTNTKTCPLIRERCTLPALPRHEDIYRWEAQEARWW